MDPFVAGPLILVFGLVGLMAAVSALGVLVRERRLSRVAVGTGLVSAAVVAVCILWVAPGYSADEQARVERLHRELAPAIERYRQAHGQYPPTLEAAGIATPRTSYGPLRYNTWRQHDGTTAYRIGYGDYLKNGFAAWWESNTGEWYVDQ